MTIYADVIARLRQHPDAHTYRLEVSRRLPGSDALPHPLEPAVITRLNLDHLGDLAEMNPAEYGRMLWAFLFPTEPARTFFAEARAAAVSQVGQAQAVPLRLRLYIDPGAHELHQLRWELLRDPQTDKALTDEQILFSRFLSSPDQRPVRPRPLTGIKALVVIANPSNVGTWKVEDGRPLAAVDVSGELRRAEESLGSIPITALCRSEGLDCHGRPTLDDLLSHLRDGYDILYLVCHGQLNQGMPELFLEDANGQVHLVSAADTRDALDQQVPGLVGQLGQLAEWPRLVVLASCQSAGQGDEWASPDTQALAALGPRLAQEGVPAVVAMQGSVTMGTVEKFMPVFFNELRRDGQIDRAMAAARRAARGRGDWWMPALFMRLESGRLWYVPGFADDQRGLEKWPALLRHISQGRCTPILGPGLTEPLIGSRREIARSWAEQYQFPMAPHACDDLPQVAQYLAVNQDPMFPVSELAEYLRQSLQEQYGNALPEDVQSLGDLISAVGTQVREQNPSQPHRVLTQLPLPIYITAEANSLLADSLREAGKEPEVELCRWNEDVEWLASIYDDERKYRPNEDRPLVYHLFGHLQEPDSIVLTEDDYFDYLIGVTGNKDLIPGVVRRALTDTALLFLGFRMDDWDFRVLFRSIMSQEGRSRRRKYAHVAVQIDPEEGRIMEPERARHYLESYFQGADISIYWGSVEDFARELQQRWEGETS